MLSVVLTDKGANMDSHTFRNLVREPESTKETQHHTIRSVTGRPTKISGK